jgi:LPS-assembly protein
VEHKKNIILFLGLFFSLSGFASVAWGQMPRGRAQLPTWEKCEWFAEPAVEELADPEPSGPVDVTADQFEAEQEGISVFKGEVKLRRRGQWLDADELRYDRLKNVAEALGSVRYQDAMFDIFGDSAKVNLETETGHAENVRYFLRDYHARGVAGRIERESPIKSLVKAATFTTCDPGDNAWQLEVSEASLDHEDGVARARHARLRMWDIPILYTPYLRFPIESKRKSGFLVPAIGTSSNTGFDASIPYYWNIAPHRDATLIPRYLSERGPMMEGEFRYLNPTNRGEFRGALLPHDSQTGESRGLFSLRHAGSPRPRWFTMLDLNLVSDDRYFEDLSNSLSIASTVFLNNQFDIGYQGDGWNALGRFQGFQIVDRRIPGDFLPYQRLPQFLLDGFFPNRFLGLDLGFHGELVNFSRDVLPAGVRLDLWPTISLPFRTAGTFFIPSAGLRDTRYFLDEAPPGVDKTLSRTLPIFSMDTGAIFERSLNIGRGNLRQTFEPRAYYLYVPFQDQQNYPVFDSAPLDFYFPRLFQPNRFAGADRMNDANQLTLAVTTRLLQPSTGDELLRLSLGQIRFFQDRKVTLPGIPEQTESGSAIIAEVAAQLARQWRLRSEVRFDPHQQQTDLGALDLRYRGKKGGLLNLGYRFRRGEALEMRPWRRMEQIGIFGPLGGIEQIDASARYPITNRWSVIGRWYYSIREETLFEVLGGVEYDSCCWAVRLVGRSHITNIEGDRNNAFLVQLELKGLGNLGQDVESLLRQTVMGYGEMRHGGYF